ncbi:MAG TPA: serine/threonine-protein kinase [Terriglobales bacterium]|nr:serine/threonine-protein kinase [Terriglobales bacterium]
MIGSTFGGYRIEDRIGAGGMGVVYRAHDVNLDRPVAIKTLLAPDTPDPAGEARFLREARAASRLQHPSIMTIHQFGVEGRTRYIVMEYVEGRTLKKMMDGRPLEVGQLLEIAVQVAEGLVTAHEHGVIHRDLKAENIMVTPRGQVKILDFGLAKLRDRDPIGDPGETRSSFETTGLTLLGTVSHMSPEQALAIEIDPRTDIFSFGVVLYEMATGKTPFSGPTPQATLARILSQEPPSIPSLNPEIPPELDRLIRNCLQKDRTCRPAARDVRDRLKNIQASLSANKLTASAIRPALELVAQKASQPSYVTIAPPVAPRAEPGIKNWYLAIRGLRKGLSVGMLLWPISFVAYFFVAGGLVRPEAIADTWFLTAVQAVAEPPLHLAHDLIAVNLRSGHWDFMVLALAAAALVLRSLLLTPVRRVEAKLNARLHGRPLPRS